VSLLFAALQGRNLGDSAALAACLLRATLNGAPVEVCAVTQPHAEWQLLLPPGYGGGEANELVLHVGEFCTEPAPVSYARPEVFTVRCCTEVVPARGGATRSGGEPSEAREVVLYVCGVNFGEGDGAEATSYSLVSVRVRGVTCPGALVIVPHCKLRVPVAPEVAAMMVSDPLVPADIEVVVGGLSSQRISATSGAVAP
jgi:hypothetical protein